MKKLFKTLLVIIMLLCLVSCKEESLPLPEVSEGMRGELGIDKNINEATIDNYLNRSDSVYRDMRMLKDEANYEAIGGDSYLSGVVKGFEVVPFPYLCNVTGLPEEVGNTYSGVTLFSLVDGEYLANYEESMEIMETLFPKDKTIFLMCGGGGYAGMTKNLLVGLGWDETKIYNTGGYWFYEGNNKIETKKEVNGQVTYDYSSIVYHDIEFDKLNKIRESGNNDNNSSKHVEPPFERIESTKQLQELENNKETFLLFVYLPSCSSCSKFLPIVEEFAQNNDDVTIYSVSLSDIYKESNSVSDRLSYTPSLFIYVDGEVVSYLDPNSQDDLPAYQTLEGLSSWIANYLDVDISSSDTNSGIEDCDSGCELTPKDGD